MDPVYAKLYRVQANGTILESSPLATQLIGSNAQYSFNAEELKLGTIGSNVDFIVKAEGCNGAVYKRPITSFDDKQNLDFNSTIVAEVINANSLIAKKINEVQRSDVETLIKNLSGTTSQSSLNSLQNTQSNIDKFTQIFGTSPSVLADARPEVSLKLPSHNLSELVNSAFQVSAFHTDPNYSFAYKWKLDGVVKSAASTFNYIPGANESGTHNIVVYVGKDDGAGNIDITKPYYTKSFSSLVNNNIGPVPPNISLDITTPGPRNINNVIINIATGVALTHCDSFSRFAFSDSNVIPGIMQFNYTCQTAGSQSETVTFVSGDGVKNIYIWAIDNEGIISSPKNVSFVLDTAPPVASITFNPALLKGGSSQNVLLSSSDAGVGMQDLKLYFTPDNSTYSLVSNLSVMANSHAWVAPLINTTNGKFKLIATDLSGSTTTVYSSLFEIDSTAPLAPTLTRTSAAISSLSNVSLTVGSCTDTSSILISETNTVPDATEIGWQICSTAAGATTSTIAGDGSHTLYAWAKDLVGHVSASANSVSVTLDTTNPLIAVTTPAPMRGNTNSGNVDWILTEMNVVAGTNFLIEIYDGLNWTSIGSKAVIPGNNLNQTYSLSNFSVPNVDAFSAKIRVSLTDASGNLGSSETNTFTIDKSAPVLSSVIINDGASYAGTAMVNVKVNVSDNISTGNQIRIRLSSADNGTSDCQSEYADNNWIAWTNPTTNIGFSIVPTDEFKKICAWAKDAAGNITVMSPTVGSNGVNTNTIEFSTGNPPEILSFSAVTTATGSLVASTGNPLTLSWSTSDVEGLSNSPISVAYTTDNSLWKDIATNADISEPSNRTWYGSFSGNPKSVSGTIVTFNSPSSSYFKLKIQSKNMAGNTSSFASSQSFNTGNWSNYAGTKDRGDNGTGRAASLYGAGFHTHFAINPINGDIYAIDEGVGLRKLDASTGIVSTIIQNGTLNLPDNGALPAIPTMPITAYLNPVFDSKGRLYIGVSNPGGYYTAIIYQIDFQLSSVRRYAGGGVLSDGGILPDALQISAGSYSFDEQDSLYVWTYCGGTQINSSTYRDTAKRIVKIAQNANGSSGATTRIIGDCALGNPSSGTSAYNQPSSTGGLPVYAGIIPWNNGNNILVLNNFGIRYKIINGIVYPSNVKTNSNTGFGVYNPDDGLIYKTVGGNGIEKVAIDTAGPNGDISTSVFTSSSSDLGCTQDGTLKTAFCGLIITRPQIRSGILYFADGAGNNVGSEYAIRYFDSSNQLRTVFGGQPFYGDGKDKSLMRGRISGIYYKKSTEPNQAAFPEGLYFMERFGLVLGHINPSTGVVSNLWGNQARAAMTPVQGTTISKNLSMGAAFGGGNGMPLTFDSNGLPWLRANNDAISIDVNNKIVRRTRQTINRNLANTASTANPVDYGLHHYGGYQNFTLKGNGLFIQPNYIDAISDPILSIRYMDFTNLVSPVIIGGNFLASEKNLLVLISLHRVVLRMLLYGRTVVLINLVI